MNRFAIACVAAVVPCIAGCDTGTEERTDAAPSRATLREPESIPAGAVPRGTSALAAATAPPGPPLDDPALTTGRQRYGTFCAACHGPTGAGDGPVVRHGFPAPPPLDGERLRRLPAAHIVGVITAGAGKMYPMAEQIPPADRWAIAGYVKLLQRGVVDVPGEAHAGPAGRQP
jgi:mono/diheme cytochrome c family protein